MQLLSPLPLGSSAPRLPCPSASRSCHYLILNVPDRPRIVVSLEALTRTTAWRVLGLLAVTFMLPALASKFVASGVQVVPPSRDSAMSTRLTLPVIDQVTL